MNILIPHSWLKEYLKTGASPRIIAELLSLSGPSVDSLTKQGETDVYDIEVTTNRIEMYSVLGIAREAATILTHHGKEAKLTNDIYQKKPPAGFEVGEKTGYLKLKLTTPLVHRFSAVLVNDVTVKPAPKQARTWLELSGYRPINNIVDVSNWLMHAYGQPVHVFDYDQILKQMMIIRTAKKGEKITTLDGKTFELPGGDLVIEDGEGRLIDLCGTMGGANSAVTPSTSRVLLFVQKYDPMSVRQTSLSLPQRTVAAQIFEKDPDPEAVLPVLFEGVKLLGAWAGGKPEKKVIDIYPKPIKPQPVELSFEKMDVYLNGQVKKTEAIKILRSLGFRIETAAKGLRATAPSWQARDIHLDVDLIEEIARIWGYNRFDSLLPSGKIPQVDPGERFELEYQTKVALKFWGYTELYSMPLIPARVAKLFGGLENHLRLKNPLGEEWEYLRASLLPVLLGAVAVNKQLTPLKLFELGTVFLPRKKGRLPEERLRLTLVTHQGHRQLLGHLQGLMKEWGIGYRVKMADGDWLAAISGGEILAGEETVGSVGLLSPALLEAYQLDEPVWALDLNLDLVKKRAQRSISMQPILKYQSIVDDLSLRLLPETPIGPIIQEIRSLSKLVRNVKVVDTWEENVTLRLEFSEISHQLTQKEVNQEKKVILARLKKKFGVNLKS